MKLQITSLEALERLIGGDSEIELQLRAGIVQNFAKKHLKHLATDELLLSVGRVVTDEIKANLVREIKQSGGFYPKTTLEFTPEMQKLFDEEFEKLLAKTIDEKLTEKLGFVMEKINKQLDAASKYIDHNLTENVLERRLDAMVDKRIKERLNLK